jgi:uncharacterized membrane protein YbhN (UPF0104 family)
MDTPVDEFRRSGRSSRQMTGMGDTERRVADAAEPARSLRRGLASVALLAVLLGGLAFAVPGLRDAIEQTNHVGAAWIALAALLELGSCLGYVVAFHHVFAHTPRRLAADIALSELAFGAVVPVGGAGGIAIGAWVVNAKGGSLHAFLERSAVLFLLTSAINVATLAVVGALVAAGVLPAPHPLLLGLVPAVVGIVAIAASLGLAARTSHMTRTDRRLRWVRATAQAIEATRRDLVTPRWRLCGAIAYLWLDIAVLWVCLRAVGGAPPVGALTLAYLVGYLGNVLPVPGGIGVLDGGLLGALVLYGAHPATAAAGVLIYHAIALWLPTLLGTASFLRIRRTLHEPATARQCAGPAPVWASACGSP